MLSMCAVRADNQNEIDSLLELLDEVSGAERYEVLYSLIRKNIEHDPFEAEPYAMEALMLSIDMGDSLKIVRASRAVGRVKQLTGHHDDGIAIVKDALEIAKRNGYQDEVSFLLNSLAISYTERGNLDKALDYHLQSLVIREQQGNTLATSISYNNIGLVYYKLRDDERALEYFEKALDLRRGTDGDYGMDRLLINIALCHSNMGQFEEALEAVEEAFESCDEECDDAIIAEGELAMGDVYYYMGDLDKSVGHLEISMAAARRTSNYRFIAENLLRFASIADKHGDPGKALSYYHEAETMLDTLDYGYIRIQLYRGIYELYRSQGDFAAASTYQSKFIELNDSIMSADLMRNLARVQTEYEERENIQTIIRQKRFNVYAVIIVTLAALLVFVLLRSNQVKKRVNRELSNAKGIIEDQNKQLTALNRNLENMVNARTIELQNTNEALKRVNGELDNFIYKTSHDIRGPLASLKGMCNVAILDVKDEVALEYFRKLDATAEKLNAILTRLLIINQINNSQAGVDLIDMTELVDEVISVQRKKGVPPMMELLSEIEPGTRFHSDRALVRIVLENLVENAVKFHSTADNGPFVKVRVTKDMQDLKILVTDNGIGMKESDPEKIFQIFSRASERSDIGGIGLYLTKTATEKIGGRIELQTTAEGYTEFCVTFALQNGRK